MAIFDSRRSLVQNTGVDPKEVPAASAGERSPSPDEQALIKRLEDGERQGVVPSPIDSGFEGEEDQYDLLSALTALATDSGYFSVGADEDEEASPSSASPSRSSASMFDSPTGPSPEVLDLPDGPRSLLRYLKDQEKSAARIKPKASRFGTLTKALRKTADFLATGMSVSTNPGMAMRLLHEASAEAPPSRIPLDLPLQLLERARWFRQPEPLAEEMARRYETGARGIDDFEWQVIDEMAGVQDGPEYLERAGLWTQQEARDYLHERDYHQFNRLRPGQRLQLAFLVELELNSNDHQHYGDPPYDLALSLRANRAGSDEAEKMAARQAIWAVDQDMWSKTLGPMSDAEHAAATAAHKGASKLAPKMSLVQKQMPKSSKSFFQQHETTTGILKKIFVLLHEFGVKNLKQSVVGDGANLPFAALLSHGGRINILLPPLERCKGDPFFLLKWLGFLKDEHLLGLRAMSAMSMGAALPTMSAPVHKRLFGTHYAGRANSESEFDERGGKGAAVQARLDPTTVQLGMNLPIGGMGKLDFNRDVILSDGAHGHMYIGFTSPLPTVGGTLQIGVESTAPGNYSTTGYVHDHNSTEKTRNPMSSTGGHKNDAVFGKDVHLNLAEMDTEQLFEKLEYAQAIFTRLEAAAGKDLQKQRELASALAGSDDEYRATKSRLGRVSSI